jgi:ABC-type polysaccharide/polyol phosphate export permease
MTPRLWTLLKKDARIVLRSRLLLIVLLLYPLVIVGIVGYAFSQPNERIPLAVLNLDVDANGDPNKATIVNPLSPGSQGVAISSGDLVDSLDELTRLSRVATEDEGRRLLLAGEVQAVVIFPKGFVSQVASYTSSAPINVIVDLSDPVRASIVNNTIRGVVQSFQEYVVQTKVDFVVDALESSLATDLRPTDYLYPGFQKLRQNLQQMLDSGNLSEGQARTVQEAVTFLDKVIDTLQSSKGLVESVAQPVFVDIEGERSGHLFIRDLVVPAAMGLSIFWTGSLATAALVVYEREAPAYARLGVTPTNRLTIIGSKVILTSGIIVFQSAMILVAAIIAFDTRVDNSFLTFILILLSTFASIGIGIFLSGITRDVNGAVLLSVLVTFPMLFLSGLFYPVSFMPSGAQILAKSFPLTYTVSGLRGAMLRGFQVGDAAVEMIALLGSGLLLTAAGIILGRRYERRR